MKTSIRLVTVLTMTALAMNTYAAEPGETDLFAAGDFSLWTQVNGEPVGEGCQINKGVVTLTGGKSGDIITREHYNDFELSFEWKISEGGNSGVKYRSKGKLGLEYQVLDDDRHEDGKDADHRSGSLYDLKAAPDDKPIQPVGKWNKSKIVVQGNHVEHWLNGKKLLEIEIGSADWEQRFEASKYTKYDGFGTWTGPILLQDHGDKVWYRKIIIKKL